MTVTVEINSLKVYAFHGVGLQERTVGNEFEVTIRVCCRISEQTMADDTLNATINYADIAEVAKDVMSEPSALIENVAWRMRNRLRERFPQIVGGHVKISKLTPPIPSTQMASAAVSIDW
ncbi:MAG: dihydroneopterin aldolase [Muribaculum sp.]|nr:dihydroneopterin aldolase [Muribaculaceae bacterium]MCM1081703.1 dihydroneopterin aldolase [Muribaculum sp.]